MDLRSIWVSARRSSTLVQEQFHKAKLKGEPRLVDLHDISNHMLERRHGGVGELIHCWLELRIDPQQKLIGNLASTSVLVTQTNFS